MRRRSVCRLPVVGQVHQKGLHTQMGQEFLSDILHGQGQGRGIDAGVTAEDRLGKNGRVQDQPDLMGRIVHQAQDGGFAGRKCSVCQRQRRAHVAAGILEDYKALQRICRHRKRHYSSCQDWSSDTGSPVPLVY